MKNTNKLIIIIASVICVAVIAATTVAISVINKNNNQTPTDPQSENESQTTTVQAKIENLQATDSDFDELEKLLENICYAGYSFEYSAEDSNAYQTALKEIIGYLGDVTLYKYIYNKDPEYIFSYSGTLSQEERDPLNKLSSYDSYGKVSADEMDWIIENIFCITPDRNNATITTDGNCSTYYYDNYYYFGVVESGDIGVVPHITNKTENENYVYTVTYDLKYDPASAEAFGYDANKVEASFEAVCALKEIDGKRQWTFSSIKKIG